MGFARKTVLPAMGCLLVAASSTSAAQPSFDKPFRLGMIGLDTSHVVAFTKAFNTAKKPSPLAKFRVVAAFKGGSNDIESSYTRVDKYTKQLNEAFGVKIYGTIEELCKNVDGIMLESVDGRPHLEQAKPVIKAGLPLFIDKPMAGTLADVLDIFRLAKAAGVPCWSSSSLRYWTPVVELQAKAKGKTITKCVAWSPCSHNKFHPDLFWYGVHGVETLYALMGPGCQSVIRKPNTDIVTGKWADGRIGIFDPKKGYGAEITIDGTVHKTGKETKHMYVSLMEQVAKFFETGKVPVEPKETIEMFAFMEGADESKRQGYKEVKISDVLAKAKKASRPAGK